MNRFKPAWSDAAEDRIQARRQDRGRRSRTRPIIEVRQAERRRHPAPAATSPAIGRTATAAPAWWKIKGERVLAPILLPQARQGHGSVITDSPRERVQALAEDGAGTTARRRTRPRAVRTSSHEGNKLLDVWARSWACKPESRFHPRRATRIPTFPPGHRGEPGCLHPVHALRARLPRRAGTTTSSATLRAAITSKIVFDFDDPMGDSTCVACGECVQACPTGALMECQPREECG